MNQRGIENGFMLATGFIDAPGNEITITKCKIGLLSNCDSKQK